MFPIEIIKKIHVQELFEIIIIGGAWWDPCKITVGSQKKDLEQVSVRSPSSLVDVLMIEIVKRYPVWFLFTISHSYCLKELFTVYIERERKRE